jgi:glutamate formiminotransferase/formiminotetrahydrofolate cyclodeaminase
MGPLLECIPNFSEGQRPEVIEAIAGSIRSVPQVYLLDVDPGASAHRTVMTFAGAPGAVVEAAFRAIAKAAELIDMSQHQGAHPRMGATDVCPLVPLRGMDMAGAVALARQLGQRVGEELGIPVYLYEKAATQPQRQNLAVIRAGEYEGFREKILDPAWRPDYGPARFHARAGQTVIGARDFLIAYNLNLNTRSARKASSVAFDIRERGRVKTVDGTPQGEKVRDAAGRPVRIPGRCKGVKAIGWYLADYDLAQVSTNVTDLSSTALHEVYVAAAEAAVARGLRVTGSELIGMVPERVLLQAGAYFLGEPAAPDRLIETAVQALGLDALRPFDPWKKVIEYRLQIMAKEAGETL